MTAVSVVENQGMHEPISEMFAELQTCARAAQALFYENKQTEGILNGYCKIDLKIAAQYKKNDDLAWDRIAEGTDLETRISLSPGRSLEDIKAKLEAARIIYAYERFSDPIAALLNDTDFEPSVVSLASILIDALRLLGNEAGDIMEMKARHEAYVREGRCRQAD